MNETGSAHKISDRPGDCSATCSSVIEETLRPGANIRRAPPRGARRIARASCERYPGHIAPLRVSSDAELPPQPRNPDFVMPDEVVALADVPVCSAHHGNLMLE